MVRVGVGCLVTYRHRSTTYFLLGQRQGSHGSNTWGLPGGHLELGETWATCARREAAEETGLNLCDWKYLSVTNDIFDPASLHYVTVFMKSSANGASNVPPVAALMEPDKCKMWAWVSWKEVVCGVAVRRDACDGDVVGCFELRDGGEPATYLDLSALFLPVANLIKVYGESEPPLD
ncbi:hypothetical protein LPJ56_000883 [Coemansia sp. RSA 2599]|nr:hypothetical protein LPJ75_000480 [Coemansia sp. RSA 2598]KAJ1828784.1 hypothetical protein LPJ56_000883 [Coemansia sp. RSA 2599]